MDRNLLQTAVILGCFLVAPASAGPKKATATIIVQPASLKDIPNSLRPGARTDQTDISIEGKSYNSVTWNGTQGDWIIAAHAEIPSGEKAPSLPPVDWYKNLRVTTCEVKMKNTLYCAYTPAGSTPPSFDSSPPNFRIIAQMIKKAEDNWTYVAKKSIFQKNTD